VPQKGDRVCFRIAHVFLPEVHEVLASLTEELEVQGTIVDFSDSGNAQSVFAVVQLDGNQAVVVSVDRLRVVAGCYSEPKK